MLAVNDNAVSKLYFERRITFAETLTSSLLVIIIYIIVKIQIPILTMTKFGRWI